MCSAGNFGHDCTNMSVREIGTNGIQVESVQSINVGKWSWAPHDLNNGM